MRYKISARTVDITASTTLMPENNYGAWIAVNIGTAAAKVMGYDLQPGEGLDFFNAIPAGSVWDSPIAIEITTGAKVRITRLQYKELKQ